MKSNSPETILTGWQIHPSQASPSYGQKVLIWNPEIESIRIAYYCRPENDFSHSTFEEWEGGKQLYVFSQNVYWMPLPQPPSQLIK